ncbi:MAG: hypothetical protein MJZ57_06625 [Bacteroidales bacterium]|nr:hypothetical protein [Bacteroidales bacterium]
MKMTFFADWCLGVFSSDVLFDQLHDVGQRRDEPAVVLQRVRVAVAGLPVRTGDGDHHVSVHSAAQDLRHPHLLQVSPCAYHCVDGVHCVIVGSNAPALFQHEFLQHSVRLLGPGSEFSVLFTEQFRSLIAFVFFHGKLF